MKDTARGARAHSADDDLQGLLPGLEGLEGPAEVPPPRRSDAAFARAVREAVLKRRHERQLVVPVLTAACAALAIILVAPGPLGTGARLTATTATTGTTGTTEPREAEPDDPAVIVSDSDFAIPALDGSSDEELARLERALDRALGLPHDARSSLVDG